MVTESIMHDYDWHKALQLLNEKGYSYRQLSAMLNRHKNYVQLISKREKPENYLKVSEGGRLLQLAKQHNLNIPKKSDPLQGQKV